MPENNDLENEDTEETPRDLRARLAEQSRETEQLRLELETTRREAEFSKALGPKSSDGWVKYFQAGYDGPVEADAIKKAAAEAGFLNTAPTETRTEPGHSWMSETAAGGAGSSTTGWQEALAEAGRLPMGPQGSDAEVARTNAILDVVERFGGTTSRSAQ